MLFHNRGVFQRFVDELRHTYGDVDRLNEAWGLTYWSHRLSTWADLWVPDGNWQPQYDLAWRTFQAKLTTEFIAWQADIVREYARDDQFVTTCIAYERPTVDDVGLTRALDVTAGNPYYAMQDALAVPSTDHGAPGVDHLGRLDPLPQRRPDVRLQAGPVPDHRDQRRRHRRLGDQLPGLRRTVAAGRLGVRGPRRGDDRVLALAHHPLRHRDLLGRHPAARPAARPGLRRAEPARRGLPHGRRAGRRPAARRGGRPALLGPIQVGARLPGRLPQARRGLRSPRRTMSTSGPTTGSSRRSTAAPSTPGSPPASSTTASSSARTASASIPAALAAELPVLIVPGLLVAGDELLAWLRAYAAAGGHLVIGPRTAYGDDEGRARTEVKPAHLADAAGVRYQEFSNLLQPVPVTPESDGFSLSAGAAAVDWIDGLVSEGSKIILGYDHPHFGQFPAVVSTEHGNGRITTVGTLPNAALAADLLRWLAPGPTSAWDGASAVGHRQLGHQPAPASGSTSCTTGAGSRYRSAFPSRCVMC